MTIVQTRLLCLIKHRYLNSKEGVRESTFHHCLTLMARMKTDKWNSKSLSYWLRMLAQCMWYLDFDLCSLDYLCLVTFNGLGEWQTKTKTRPDCEKRPLASAQIGIRVHLVPAQTGTIRVHQGPSLPCSYWTTACSQQGNTAAEVSSVLHGVFLLEMKI